jgi:hypothetical protein
MKELAALAYRDTTAENREFWKNELSQAIHDIQVEYSSKLDGMRGELATFYDAKVNKTQCLPPKNQRNNSAHFTYIFKQF